MYLNKGNYIQMGNFKNVKITNMTVNITGCGQYQKRENNESSKNKIAWETGK